MIQQDHSSAIEGMLEGVTFMNGMICVKVDDTQQPLQVSMQDGQVVGDNTIEPSPVKPLDQVKPVRHVEERSETMVRKTTRQQGAKFGTVLRGRSR
jgi:hypothetical protein